jgi:hypothetical protein
VHQVEIRRGMVGRFALQVVSSCISAILPFHQDQEEDPKIRRSGIASSVGRTLSYPTKLSRDYEVAECKKTSLVVGDTLV